MFGNTSVSLKKILVMLAWMDVLNIFPLQTYLLPFSTLLCALKELTYIGYLIGYSFPLTYAKNWRRLEARRRAWCWYLFPWVHPGDITMACLLLLTIAVVLSGDSFHTALSSSLFSLLLLYLALSSEECKWYNTSWFPSTLPIHITLGRLANLCIPSVFFKVPNNAKICLFTLSGWLSKAIVFWDSAIGFWPKKSNHIYIIKA